MPRFVFVVYTNPVRGREEEYNEWYTNRHLDDLLACPGVVSARRLKLCSAQVKEVAMPHRYLALYEIETDDPQRFYNELFARNGTDPISSALAGDAHALMWEVIER